MSNGSQLRRLRWWPAAVVLAVVLAGQLWVWSGEAGDRQQQVLSSFFVYLVGGVLLLLWMLLFSRVRRRTRLLSVFGVLLAVAAVAAAVEIRGVSGDLVPIFAWRWSTSEAAATVESAGTGVGAPAAPTVGEQQGLSFPQFLGPLRNATVPGVRLKRDWEADPPRELWRIPLGQGWSGFAISGRFAVTQEQRGDEERVACYDLLQGKLIWSHVDRTRHHDPLGGTGPRATPAIDGDRVYSVGATGLLNALRLETGERLWSRDVVQENGARVPEYGMSGSPLVHGDRVVVAAGGADGRSLVAYDKFDGERLWSAGGDPVGYSSPVTVELAGTNQILLLTDLALVAHDPETGAVLWRHPWTGETQKVAQPVALPGDRVLVSTGYGVGARLFRVVHDDDGWRAAIEWESRGLKAKFTNVAHLAGAIYGLDDGILVALDVETGERRWKRGRYGHGQLLLVDDLLLIQAEYGVVALVEASPDEYRELGRIEALDGKGWNSPALAGPYLVVRNDREAVCYELAIE